jgi:flagellar hook-associated protein 2
MSGITFSGLSSGIDTDPLIEQLSRFRQARIDTLTARQEEAVSNQTVFKTVEARVLTLNANIARLSKSRNGVFDGRTATSSNESLIKAAASSSAAVGVHTLKVLQTAKANIVGSQGFESQTAEINTGTFQISAGGASETITIDSTNNTLAGLAAEVNAAGIGVQATIIDDGSGATPYRLLLTSQKTGTENSVSITNNLTTGSAATPDFSTTVQAAADAQIQIGDGAGAITVSNATNTFDSLIPGVTLEVQSADVDQEVTISIANDTSGIRSSIEGFVEEFNALMAYIDEQTRFDPETTTGGPLVGNRQLIGLQDQIRQNVLSVSPNLSSGINRLSAIGISINSIGRLSIDDGKLSSFLNGTLDGLDFGDVKKAFALNGDSTNTGIRFIFGSNKTLESGSTPYKVDITRAAERASITATNTITDSTVIDSSNNTFTLTVDGVGSNTIELAEGTYTRDELAAELEAKLRADEKIGRREVSVSVSNDSLVFTTTAYGTAAEVSELDGTAISSGILGFDGSESDVGEDVAGSFIVNGETETAVGVGQVLRGLSTNTNTADLNVIVDLTSAQLVSGSEAELSVTRGIAARLSLVFESIVDPVSGRLSSINDSFTSAVDQIAEQIVSEQALLDDQQASLLRQFAAMEAAISNSQANGNAITNSLAPLLTRNSS